MEQKQSALKNVITRQMAGVNAIQISVVEDENADNFKSRYFAFLKGVPSENSDTSPTGKTYNYKKAINIKLEAEKIFALANALTICAEGKFDPYERNFGIFEIHADTSRSSFSDGGGKKSVRVSMLKNTKTDKFVITLSFISDNSKAVGYFSPYEAVGFAKSLEFCANKILELEFCKNTGFMTQKAPIPQSNGFKPNPPQHQEQTPESGNSGNSSATSGFKEMFTSMPNMESPFG